MGGLYQLFQCFSAIFYPEGQQSLKDPVMCRYRSLRGFLRSNGNSRETIREWAGRFDGRNCDKMRKRQITGIPLRFPSSKIYADEYWGKYKKNDRWTLWLMIVRFVEGAWTADCAVGGLLYAGEMLTGHWRDTDGAKTDWKLIPDSKWLFRNCSVMFP